MQVCNSPTNSPNRRGALPRGIPLHAVGQLVDSHLLSHIPSPSKREGDVDREGREQVSHEPFPDSAEECFFGSLGTEWFMNRTWSTLCPPHKESMTSFCETCGTGILTLSSTTNQQMKERFLSKSRGQALRPAHHHALTFRHEILVAVRGDLMEGQSFSSFIFFS